MISYRYNPGAVIAYVESFGLDPNHILQDGYTRETYRYVGKLDPGDVQAPVEDGGVYYVVRRWPDGFDADYLTRLLQEAWV